MTTDNIQRRNVFALYARAAYLKANYSTANMQAWKHAFNAYNEARRMAGLHSLDSVAELQERFNRNAWPYDGHGVITDAPMPKAFQFITD